MTASRRGLRRVAAAALCAGLLSGLSTSAALADAGAEAGFIDKANEARAERGADALRIDAELTAVARRWSAKMAQAQSLSHNPNLPSEVTQDWEKLAENVGVGPTVEEVHTAFMASTSHRTKILDPVFTTVGVGVVIDAKGRMWVTEVFMKLRGGGASPATTAAPTPTTSRPPSGAPAPVPSTPTAPVTTARPRVQAPRPAPAPATTTAPAPAPASEAPVAELRQRPVPSARLVLVLEGLRSLDGGR